MPARFSFKPTGLRGKFLLKFQGQRESRLLVFEWKFVCGAYQLMDYHLDFNSCVYLLKSGTKKIPLNFQMVSLPTK